MPSLVVRSARPAILATPRSRRSLTASSTLPPVSARARLQSIRPALVISRTVLTSAAVGLYSVLLMVWWNALRSGRGSGLGRGRLGFGALGAGAGGLRLSLRGARGRGLRLGGLGLGGALR